MEDAAKKQQTHTHHPKPLDARKTCQIKFSKQKNNTKLYRVAVANVISRVITPSIQSWTRQCTTWERSRVVAWWGSQPIQALQIWNSEIYQARFTFSLERNLTPSFHHGWFFLFHKEKPILTDTEPGTTTTVAQEFSRMKPRLSISDRGKSYGKREAKKGGSIPVLKDNRLPRFNKSLTVDRGGPGWVCVCV